MITIKIEKNKLSISGHSNVNGVNCEAVCSSISTVTQFLQNLYDYEYMDSEDGYVFFDIDLNTKGVKVFLKLVYELENQYPEHISVQLN